jgi:acylaminoacyl-peptidase
LLVIHGGKDFRVPTEQGIAAYNAARRAGVPTELLVFPDENHWVLKPQNSVQWYRKVGDWIDRWTGNVPPVKATTRQSGQATSARDEAPGRRS